MRRPLEASRTRKSRRADVRPRSRAATPASAGLSLGDLVSALHDRARERGMSEADATRAAARGLEVALPTARARRLVAALHDLRAA